MIIYIFFFAHWYLSLFTQSFFHHRYSAHRQFTMSPLMEKVFYFLSWIFQGSSYLSPRAYGILHRMHHAHTDTPQDVHSPKYDGTLFKMMWKTKNIYNDIFYNRLPIESQYLKNLPVWEGMDRLADSWFSRLFWSAFYISFYVYFVDMPEHWYQFLLLPIHFVMGPFHGAIINWFAHKYGYRNHELEDTSRNLMFPDILMWGEGYHNNHHKFPSRANFGTKWYEIDPMYPLIILFSKVGIIKMARA